MNPRVHKGYPDMGLKQFPYAATNPHRKIENVVAGGFQPARFRDTVLARTRLDALRRCNDMGLTHVVVYPPEAA